MRGGEGICVVMRTVRSLEFLITGFAGGANCEALILATFFTADSNTKMKKTNE